MELLVEKQIPLTACPVNVAGKKYKLPENDPYMSWNWDNFPFKTFHRKGMLVTVNTDTPALSNYNLADVYITLIEHYEFTRNDVITWARNSFNATFLNSGEKQYYSGEIDKWLQNFLLPDTTIAMPARLSSTSTSEHQATLV